MIGTAAHTENVKLMNQTHYLAWQTREVDEHKYFLSQKRGYDVGYHEAYLDWIESAHAARFREVAEEHADGIDMLCAEYCNNRCKGVGKCPLPLETIHEILEDGF